jgi:hypothetical protein
MPKKDLKPPHQKPTSLVIGAYGVGNFGDELLYLAAANIETLAGFRPICCGYGPAQIKAKTKFISLSQAADYILESPPGSRVALGGGGLFWSEESTARFSSLLALAKMKGLTTAVHGIGTQGPGAALKTSLKLLHESADIFSVRDQRSLDIMIDAVGPTNKIKMLGDLVERNDSRFLFEKAKHRRRKKGPIKIGLNLGWARVSQDAGFRHHTCLSLANAARQLIGKFEFVYVPQVMHKMSMDEQCGIFAEWLRVASDGLIKAFPPPTTAEDFVLTVAECDLILAGRFHTAICAKQLGLPFAMLCISDEDKLDKYHSYASANDRLSIPFDRHNWEVTDAIVGAVNGMYKELSPETAMRPT